MKLLRRLLNLIPFAVGLYGVLVILFLLLRLIIGEAFLPVALFNRFLPILLLISLALMILSLLFRRLRLFALQLPALLAFILMYGGIPHSPDTPPGETRFTLMTYNVLVGRDDSVHIVDNIRAANADVVALQEITLTYAEAIERELSDLYPYIELNPAEESSGQGFLSRYPIVETEYWQINWGHQRALIEIGDEQVAIYSVHPRSPFSFTMRFDPSLHLAEIQEILARAASENVPVVIAGDFNMSDQSAAYAHIVQAGYGDVHRAVGGGLGMTHTLGPFWERIDYVFYSEHIVPIDIQVWDESGGSNHLPVIVELSLIDGE